MRVSGCAWWSLSTSAGAGSVPKLSSTTSGECLPTAASISSIGTSRSTSSRFGSSPIRTSSPTDTRSSNFPATTVGIHPE